jgi:hypothetical protein
MSTPVCPGGPRTLTKASGADKQRIGRPEIVPRSRRHIAARYRDDIRAGYLRSCATNAIRGFELWNCIGRVVIPPGGVFETRRGQSCRCQSTTIRLHSPSRRSFRSRGYFQPGTPPATPGVFHSDPYARFAGNFAIGGQGAEGQVIPIGLNTALFSLLGNMYGGDGSSNFALPDLDGRTLIGGAPLEYFGRPPSARAALYCRAVSSRQVLAATLTSSTTINHRSRSPT